MKIKEIGIKGIGGIYDLTLSFNEHMNILCGANGIGKTTIIESVASMFFSGHPIVKRNVACERGSIRAILDVNGSTNEKEVSITDFIPDGQQHINTFNNYVSKLLSIKVNRVFNYLQLSAVPSDQSRSDYDLWNESRDGISFDGVKGWFVNRYLYSSHPGTLSSEQVSNYQLAEKCFSIINPEYTFSKVLGATNDIMVNTPHGEIYFEYLSSGFKSILSILFSIIKEIEFRFKEHMMTADQFDGIILIDEVEIHLHPEWQERIVKILKSTFPKAQFIVTTHSPHIIQAADVEEVIALCLDSENNVVTRNDLALSGFKGWTIEEILYDVMDMKTLRTEIFNDYYKKFNEYIEKENYCKAGAIYKELDKLLHPKNIQRKLMKFQLANIAEND